MAASNGYRPMLESEWKAEYGRPFSDLVVVDYDTHPRYGRGTVLTRSGTEIMATGDKWRNRPIEKRSTTDDVRALIEANSPANEAGLPDSKPPLGLPEPTIVRYYAYQSDGNGGWYARTSFGSMQTGIELYGDEIDKGIIRIAVEKAVVEWVQ